MNFKFNKTLIFVVNHFPTQFCLYQILFCNICCGFFCVQIQNSLLIIKVLIKQVAWAPVLGGIPCYWVTAFYNDKMVRILRTVLSCWLIHRYIHRLSEGAWVKLLLDWWKNIIGESIHSSLVSGQKLLVLKACYNW